MPDTEVTIQYMITLLIVVRRDEGCGLHIAKVVVYDEAVLQTAKATRPTALCCRMTTRGSPKRGS